MVFGFLSTLNPLRWFGSKNKTPKKSRSSREGSYSTPTKSEVPFATFSTPLESPQIPSPSSSSEVSASQLNDDAVAGTFGVNCDLDTEEFFDSNDVEMALVDSRKASAMDKSVHPFATDWRLPRQRLEDVSEESTVSQQTTHSDPIPQPIALVRVSKVIFFIVFIFPKRHRSSSNSRSPAMIRGGVRKVPRMGVAPLRKTQYKAASSPSRNETSPPRIRSPRKKNNIITNLSASNLRKHRTSTSSGGLSTQLSFASSDGLPETPDREGFAAGIPSTPMPTRESLNSFAFLLAGNGNGENMAPTVLSPVLVIPKEEPMDYDEASFRATEHVPSKDVVNPPTVTVNSDSSDIEVLYEDITPNRKPRGRPRQCRHVMERKMEESGEKEKADGSGKIFSPRRSGRARKAVVPYEVPLNTSTSSRKGVLNTSSVVPKEMNESVDVRDSSLRRTTRRTRGTGAE